MKVQTLVMSKANSKITEAKNQTTNEQKTL